MKRPSLLTFALILFFNGVSRADVPVEKSAPAPLTFVVRPLELRSQGLATKPMNITSSAQAETPQRPSAAGLKLEIDLFNQGDEDIKLSYFPDFVRLNITNKKGNGLRLPEIPLSALRFSWRGGDVLNTPDKRRLQTPYQIISLKIDGRELTEKEIYDDRTIDFPAKSHLTFRIAIDRVLMPVDDSQKEGKLEQAGQPTLKEVPLPPGIYRIRQEISLKDDKNSKRYLYLCSSLEESGQVLVDYVP